VRNHENIAGRHRKNRKTVGEPQENHRKTRGNRQDVAKWQMQKRVVYFSAEVNNWRPFLSVKGKK
jgi:hypothetical protein